MFCFSRFFDEFSWRKSSFQILPILGIFLVLGLMGFSGFKAYGHYIAPLCPSSGHSLDCSSFGLPGEWAKVPVEDNFFRGKDFCVMSYEAKAWLDRNGNHIIDGKEIKSNGCEGKDGDHTCVGFNKDNWASKSYLPVSVAKGRPWREIDRNQARASCERLNDVFSENIKDTGMRFGLITNRQWQLLAWSIELNGENWSRGEVGEGCLKQGNTGNINACSYNGENPEKGCSHKKARHRLLNGPAEEFVCHVGGNVSEWVFDDNSFSQRNNQYMNKYSGTNYGPLGNYSCDDSRNPIGCGLGHGYLQGSSAGAVRRGGLWDDYSYAGVFAVHRRDLGPLSSYGGVGFRCALSLLTESNSSTEESGFE